MKKKEFLKLIIELQNHEEMEEMKTSERDEEVDESEKLKDQLPVDLETKEVEDKVDERLVIQDEPLDLSLPKPTSTTSTEVVNGQCNWSKTSQSKQKLSFKVSFETSSSEDFFKLLFLS